MQDSHTHLFSSNGLQWQVWENEMIDVKSGHAVTARHAKGVKTTVDRVSVFHTKAKQLCIYHCAPSLCAQVLLRTDTFLHCWFYFCNVYYCCIINFWV